jgi:hypothetical protein
MMDIEGVVEGAGGWSTSVIMTIRSRRAPDWWSESRADGMKRTPSAQARR